MTDVTIEIINYRYDLTEDEPETISYRTQGTCRSSRDGLKLEYTEPDVTGMDNTVTTVTSLKNGMVSVNRVGQISTHMVFEEGKLHSCIYNTGYFPMQLSILTTRLENALTATGGCLDIEYSLEVGGMHSSKNRMRYVVTPLGVVS